MADNDLDILRNAAKVKLGEQVNAAEDIYKDFRSEDIYPEIKSTPISKQQDLAYEEIPIDENDFEIFKDGPLMSQVEVWKSQFGSDCVMEIQIAEVHFVIRTLNRYEYKQIQAMNNIDAFMREEILCNTCVLFPRNYDFKVMAAGNAGYPSTLAEILLETSGFTKQYGLRVL